MTPEQIEAHNKRVAQARTVRGRAQSGCDVQGGRPLDGGVRAGVEDAEKQPINASINRSDARETQNPGPHYNKAEIIALIAPRKSTQQPALVDEKEEMPA